MLDKPSGWAVHPTGEGDAPDLMTWANDTLDSGQAGRFSPAHRLDKETSGIVICSPSGAARARVGAWFGAGEVKKVYLALVHGRTRKKGIVRKKLKDGRRGRALEAVTRYTTLGRWGALSLLRVRPETGRKHQIRRHLQGIGHAIVGDERYRPARFKSVPSFPGRLWLHAHQLELPEVGSFTSELPEGLSAHLEALKEREAQ